MSAKPKNPLYVVKGDQVEEANNFVDLIIKKLNLEPLIEVMINILKMLLENIQSYSAFTMVKDYLDFLVQRFELFRKFSIV